MRADIQHKARLLFEIDGDALEGMVADPLEEAQSVLGDGQEPLLLRRHGDAGGRVGVKDASRIRPCTVDRRMNDEAGGADVKRVVVELVAVDIHLDEVGGVHLLIKQPEGIDEEMLALAGDAQGDMIVDHIRHPVVGAQMVARGQLHARRPLHVADPVP